MQATAKETFYRNNPHCWTIITPHGMSPNFFETPADKKERLYSYLLSIKDKKFQGALKLSELFAPPERRLVVLPETCGRSALEIVRDRECGAVLLYPEHAGTAASVFLALTRILSRDRDATVIINPLEHWLPDRSIVEAVADAVQIVERISQKAILLAGDSVPEDRNPLKIQPGQKYRQSLFPQLWTVSHMSNGTNSSRLRKTANSGLHYRSVVVAKAKLIWKLGFWCLRTLLPAMARFSDENAGAGMERKENNSPACHRNGNRSWSFTDNLLMRVPRSLVVMKLPEAG